jgi:uncharacterized protein YndB with AHSA1/START domain
MPTGNLSLMRVLRAAPEKVYKALLDPDALVKWMPPHGFTAKVHHLEARVGGTFRMSFTNLGTGGSHAFGGAYLELEEGRRVRVTDTFENPGLPGQMITTYTLTPVACGTELRVEQEGIPEMIPVEMCHLGWQESLQLLTLLVEPEIPDGA